MGTGLNILPFRASWFKKSSKKTCNLSQWQYFMEICQQNPASLLCNQHRRNNIWTSPTCHPILWQNPRPSQLSSLPKRQSSGKQKTKDIHSWKLTLCPKQINSWKTNPSLLEPSAILKDKLAVKPLHHWFPVELYESQLTIYQFFLFLGILELHLNPVDVPFGQLGWKPGLLVGGIPFQKKVDQTFLQKKVGKDRGNKKCKHQTMTFARLNSSLEKDRNCKKKKDLT